MDLESGLLFPFVENGQFGLRRANGSRVIEPCYCRASRSSNGVSKAYDGIGQIVLIDAVSLRQQICEGFESSPGASYCHGRIAIRPMAEKEPMDRYVDAKGRQTVAGQYSHGRNFDSFGATVKVNASDKVVCRIDFDGHIVGAEYRAIRPFHPSGNQCGATVRWSSPGMVLIDGLGRQISSDIYVEVWQENEGLTPVKLSDDLVGLLDTDGNLVDSVSQRAIGNHFESGLVPIQDFSEKWGLMNRKLEWVIEPLWDVIESVGENRFLAGSRDQEENTSVQLIDGCGHIFGSHSFEWIDRFQDGVAKVSRLPRADAAFEDVSDINFIDMQGELLFDDWV